MRFEKNLNVRVCALNAKWDFALSSSWPSGKSPPDQMVVQSAKLDEGSNLARAHTPFIKFSCVRKSIDDIYSFE